MRQRETWSLLDVVDLRLRHVVDDGRSVLVELFRCDGYLGRECLQPRRGAVELTVAVDVAAVLPAKALGELLVRHAVLESVGDALGDLDRVEVGSVDVLCEARGGDPNVGDVNDQRGDRCEALAQSPRPSTFSTMKHIGSLRAPARLAAAASSHLVPG